MSCIDHIVTACPFAFSELSEQVQNHGCLPSPQDIITMRVEHGKTWACHSYPTKPCLGALRLLKERGLPHEVIDPELITESHPWHLYCEAKQ